MRPGIEARFQEIVMRKGGKFDQREIGIWYLRAAEPHAQNADILSKEMQKNRERLRATSMKESSIARAEKEKLRKFEDEMDLCSEFLQKATEFGVRWQEAGINDIARISKMSLEMAQAHKNIADRYFQMASECSVIASPIKFYIPATQP